jgi:hypothetical protein
MLCNARVTNIAVDGHTAKEKAGKTTLKVGGEFKCMNEWHQCFKDQWSITWQAMNREGATADVDSEEKWHENVINFSSHIMPQRTFLTWKKTVFYITQLKRTKASEGEQCYGGKWYKNRTVVHLCCNADGSEKLCPLMIGELQKCIGN